MRYCVPSTRCANTARASTASIGAYTHFMPSIVVLNSLAADSAWRRFAVLHRIIRTICAIADGSSLSATKNGVFGRCGSPSTPFCVLINARPREILSIDFILRPVPSLVQFNSAAHDFAISPSESTTPSNLIPSSVLEALIASETLPAISNSASGTAMRINGQHSLMNQFTPLILSGFPEAAQRMRRELLGEFGNTSLNASIAKPTVTISRSGTNLRRISASTSVIATMVCANRRAAASSSGVH